MDIRNDTQEPVIVEAERGGDGDPPDPPYRYELMRNKNKYYDNKDGGAIRVGQKATVDFQEMKNVRKINLHVFQQDDGYAGCRRASLQGVPGNGSFVFKRRNDGTFVIE